MDLDPDKAEITFQKKMDMTGEEEPCAECLAKKVCRLQADLHKVKVPGYETTITRCDLYLE